MQTQKTINKLIALTEADFDGNKEKIIKLITKLKEESDGEEGGQVMLGVYVSSGWWS